MKHIALIIFFFYYSTSIGQDCEIPVNEIGEFEYVEIVDAPSHSKAEIYDAALLSLSDFVANSDKLTKFRDREVGAFVSEIEVSLKPALGIDNLFFFNIKVEVKEGKFRITLNYIENLFIVTEDESCRCRNDLASPDCNSTGCIVMKKRWAKLKCDALVKLDMILSQYINAVGNSLLEKDW